MKLGRTAKLETTPLSDLITDYLATGAARNLSRNTTRLYEIALNRFDTFAGSVDVAEITPRMLRRYIFSLQNAGLADSTVHHYFLILGFFFTALKRDGHLADDPSADVPVPRKGKRLPKFLSESQAQALLDSCPDWTWAGRRDKTAIYLLLGTGLRLAEMLSLDLSSLDLETGYIQVVGKGNKERRIACSDDVLAALGSWLALRGKVLNGRPQNALFINRSCGRMGKSFGQSVKRAGDLAGFHCTPHMLRHTFSTQFILAGGDSMILKEILGHSNLSITEIYVHLAQRDFSDAVNSYSITKKLRFDSRQMSLL